MIQPLSTDDLLWLIGQKDAALLLLSRQAQDVVAENERLKTEIKALTAIPHKESPNGSDGRQTSDAPLPAEAPAGTATG